MDYVKLIGNNLNQINGFYEDIMVLNNNNDFDEVCSELLDDVERLRAKFAVTTTDLLENNPNKEKLSWVVKD